jgi:uncharacterized membrane protein YGL010W
MENKTIETTLFYGKIGVDNLLLMSVGLLYLAVYALKRQEGNFQRLHVDLSAGLFFLLWGFSLDLYRFKALRPYLLYNFSFQPFKTLALVVTLLPLYISLLESLIRIIKARRTQKRKKTRFKP